MGLIASAIFGLFDSVESYPSGYDFSEAGWEQYGEDTRERMESMDAFLWMLVVGTLFACAGFLMQGNHNRGNPKLSQ